MSHFLHTFPIAPFNTSLGPCFKPHYVYKLYSIQSCTMELEYSSERV